MSDRVERVSLTQPGNWPGPGPVDWAAIRDWDERYYAHVFVSAEEYVHQAVVRADGDFVELADGSRLLDFTSGLLCANAGHRNERIRDAIVEALNRYGFVWEGYATDYRARAAKLIVEDLLDPDDRARHDCGRRRRADLRRRHVPPHGRVPAAAPRADAPPRDPLDRRRGDDRLRTRRQVVRVPAPLGRDAGHHGDREGHDFGR